MRYTVDHIESWVTRQHAMYAAVRDLDKPCIVAFNGVAAGAGLQIALCADLRIGFPEMKLGQPEIKAGLASIVGSYLMTMHLGLSKNVELSLTGEMITGDVAHGIGILNHLVPRSEVMSKSFALAAEMSKLAPTAFRLTKQHFRSLTQAGFAAAMEAGKRAALLRIDQLMGQIERNTDRRRARDLDVAADLRGHRVHHGRGRSRAAARARPRSGFLFRTNPAFRPGQRDAAQAR